MAYSPFMYSSAYCLDFWLYWPEDILANNLNNKRIIYEANIKKVQPVKVVAPFLNSQSESPVPLDALTDQEKVSDLYFLKGTVHQIAKPYLSINNCTLKLRKECNLLEMSVG